MERWLNCPVDGQISWPSHTKKIFFNEFELILHPLTKDSCPSLQLNLHGLDVDTGMTAANRFLSTLCWKDDQPVRKITWGVITAFYHPFSREEMRYAVHAPTDYFPERITGPTEPKQQLALALYREGRSLNEIPYQFLSYFKIINILYYDRTVNGRNELKKWLRTAVNSLVGREIQDRISHLQKKYGNVDIVKHLYTSCRCAIAHAHVDPVIDPDDVRATRNLSEDICIIKELAEIIIEKEMGVSRSIWE